MMMYSVVDVKVLENFHLEVTFHTGERGIFDVRPYMNKGIFVRLRDPSLFNQAYIAFDTVCWPGGLDIAPATIYRRMSEKMPIT